jgi:hypothetical protein
MAARYTIFIIEVSPEEICALINFLAVVDFLVISINEIHNALITLIFSSVGFIYNFKNHR